MKLSVAAILLAALLAPVAPAQTSDPVDLFTKGMNALSGTGPSRNPTQAVDYLRRSAERGYAPAQVALAYLYEKGELVAGGQTDALNWYRKAAEQGDSIGLWVVGRMYLTGFGTPTSLDQAEKWLLRSAEQGNPFGEYLLGLVREDRDYRSAPEWFRKAAEQGLPFAQQKLGLLLKEGRGVNIDRYRAYVWLLLSFESGLKTSGTFVSELEGVLSSADVERAKTEVREVQTRYSRAVIADGCTGWPGELDAIPTTPPPDIQRLCR